MKDHRQNDILNFNGKNFTEAMFGRNISWLKEPSFLITFPQPGDEKRNDKKHQKEQNFIQHRINLNSLNTNKRFNIRQNRKSGTECQPDRWQNSLLRQKKTNGTKQGREGWEFKIFKENGSIDKLKRPPLEPNWQIVDKNARRLRRANENTRSLSFWGPISHSARKFFSHRIWTLNKMAKWSTCEKISVLSFFPNLRCN